MIFLLHSSRISPRHKQQYRESTLPLLRIVIIMTMTIIMSKMLNSIIISSSRQTRTISSSISSSISLFVNAYNINTKTATAASFMNNHIRSLSTLSSSSLSLSRYQHHHDRMKQSSSSSVAFRRNNMMMKDRHNHPLFSTSSTSDISTSSSSTPNATSSSSTIDATTPTTTTTSTVNPIIPVVYPFNDVEKKWQQYWDDHNTFVTPTTRKNPNKKYILDMFPYPSGNGLHVGHPEGYTASDIMARYYRMKQYDVMHPIGWDSFGLPAEQYAIQTGQSPEITTATNIANFKRQLKMLGFSYDWNRELATTDIEYVKWTQWIFLQLYKNNLAKQSYITVNWCEELGTVLANEEIINGLSERGDYPIKRIPLRQWQLQITKYADQLLAGLNNDNEDGKLDWPAGTVMSQKQWIGKSVGTKILFPIINNNNEEEKTTDDDNNKYIEVFTTRVDTIMGVTYITIAPEHPFVSALTTSEYSNTVQEYVRISSSKSDLDRTSSQEKTGVFTGSYVQHPLLVNNSTTTIDTRIPIWISDYVLGSYGTGAVMAVPAHDTRDYAFAQKYKLPIKHVIGSSDNSNDEDINNDNNDDGVYTEYGILKNSFIDGYDGMKSEDAIQQLNQQLNDIQLGGYHITYKLRDWVFSRQRYWGEPIPIYFPVTFPDGIDPMKQDPINNINCIHTIQYDEPIPVPEDELPLKLPIMEDFQPGNDPAGCLARAREWRYFIIDNKWYSRETNTMPQWAGSCWYYFRYLDVNNKNEAFSKQVDNDWMPVDLYIGGSEHAVLHLLYARFWHLVLYDLGYTKHKEPFTKLIHQGMILGYDGEKMSKSRGNVVNPDDIVNEYGADALRLYEMFMGPLEAVKPWQTEQVTGVVRFMNRVYNIVVASTTANMKPNTNIDEIDDEMLRMMHKTMKKVTDDIDAMSFNTAISALMVYSTYLQNWMKINPDKAIPLIALENLILMVSPFAPHIGEECWYMIGHTDISLAYHPWVEYDIQYCIDNVVTIGIQINGKTRSDISIEKDATQDDIMKAIENIPKVQSYITDKEIKKIIYVPGRIINIIVK